MSSRWYPLLLDPVLIGWKKKGLRLWPPRKGVQVLDVGCGTGAHLNLYRQAGCHVFGLDFSTGMLAATRRKFGDSLNLLRADAGMMPHPSRTFDLILISLMLHEIRPHKRAAVLSEAERVLKNSGRMLIIDYRCENMNGLFGRLLKQGITLIERAAGREHFHNYRSFMKNGGLPPLLRKHRLRIERRIAVARGNIGLNLVKKLH